jgi:hypothetical protein
MDIKSYRGANIDSNHYLVIACQRVRISSVKQVTGSKTRKYSVSKQDLLEWQNNTGNK